MQFLNYFLTIAATIASVITLYLFFEEDFIRLKIKITGGIPNGFIIFISGTNGAGKTTIANKVAKKIGVSSVVEVDDLRETLRASKELYEAANLMEEYNSLSISTYLSNNNNYIEQCKLMSKIIKAVALRKQKKGLSAIFEGINILPTELIKNDIPAEYILFVNLKVIPPELLKRRLYKKTDNVEKRNAYVKNFQTILTTDSIIDQDFQLIDKAHKIKGNQYSNVYHITIYNNKSARRTVWKIIREVRKISRN